MPSHFLLEKLINHSTRHLAPEQKQGCEAGWADWKVTLEDGRDVQAKGRGCVSVDPAWEDLIAGQSRASPSHRSKLKSNPLLADGKQI